MYTKVSIPKKADGAGAPTAKKPTIVIIDIDDVDTFPAREVGSPNIAGNITLKTGKTAVGVFATPSSISITREVTGEVDGRSLIKGVEYDHPGDSDEIGGHIEAYLNKGVIILVTECDEAADGRVRIIGSPCNPAYLEPEYTNSNEATRNRFVWKQAQGDKFGIGTYSGEIPALAGDGGSEGGA